MIGFAVGLECGVVGVGVRRNTGPSSGIFVGVYVGGVFVRVASSCAILASNDARSVFMMVVIVLFFSLSERCFCSSWSMVLKRSVVFVDISSMLSRA